MEREELSGKMMRSGTPTVFDGELLHASLLMGGIYAFFVLMAAIELIGGVPAMQEEANWIRQLRS